MRKPGILVCLIRAWLLTGVTDGLFACVLSVAFFHSTVARLWQGVASVLLGPEALQGGAKTLVLGVLMHFGVAFAWSAVFLILVLSIAGVRHLLVRPYDVAIASLLYGPFIWIVMSLAVIPALTHNPPNTGVRWWIQLIGHIPFVAFPMIASIRPLAVRPATGDLYRS